MSDFFVGSEPRTPYTGPWVDLELAPGFVVTDAAREPPPKCRREGSRVQFGGQCDFIAAAARTESWFARIPVAHAADFFLPEVIASSPRMVVLATLAGTTRIVTACVVGIGLNEVQAEEGESEAEVLANSDVGKIVIQEGLDVVSGRVTLQTMSYLLDSWAPGE